MIPEPKDFYKVLVEIRDLLKAQATDHTQINQLSEELRVAKENLKQKQEQANNEC